MATTLILHLVFAPRGPMRFGLLDVILILTGALLSWLLMPADFEWVS